jgi:hypothetical protein
MKRVWLGLVVAVWLIEGCGGSGAPEGALVPSADYRQSVRNVYGLTEAMFAYTADHDDVYPPAGQWMDGLEPYVGSANTFVSPAVPKSHVGRGFGYAFNFELAGLKTFQVMSPDTTVLLFDSTFLGRNTTATAFSLPDPPRYDVSNTIAYASGRIQDGYLLGDSRR